MNGVIMASSDVAGGNIAFENKFCYYTIQADSSKGQLQSSNRVASVSDPQVLHLHMLQLQFLEMASNETEG